ncbi:MAG: beta-galactosidase, partial [Verrucomicrobiae bacterium]|nr:beta-galactosidase [Verrucomicrobiae bacterium]NNJ87682.1 beta-galactosidase [Akkermansiaceae bacterium]
GMLDQAHDFMKASGALAAICKREDIESALRTPDLGGYQLLDIQDFAGQGTALVGMLDVFMNSKGIITPKQRRRYCSPTVPLMQMKKYTWTNSESLRGRVQVAHFGPQTISDAVLSWSLVNSEGKALAGGRFEPVKLEQGRLTEVDVLCTSLSEVKTPQKLNLWLKLDGTEYENVYPLWVYPEQVDTTVPEEVLVTKTFNDAKTRRHLDGGGAVLLLPDPNKLPKSVRGSFQAGFWSPMFMMGARRKGLEDPPVTLGVLCDPKHPALAHFPTEFHSNWQWWYLTTQARPIILDETPKDYRPVVQMIDSIGRMHKLGLMFETRVGKGRLFVCAADLMSHQDQPEVRQMLHSLLRYTGSEKFNPADELNREWLEKILP